LKIFKKLKKKKDGRQGIRKKSGTQQRTPQTKSGRRLVGGDSFKIKITIF